ncbi:FxSxx-COOH system tetratricopeptide repeat protein [Phytohabitans kaempferiae]|uniref:FxSxx-COOH system tetratricopeptide repeat protein n=1 Tax=Phytohabitans kaempferiae TaxID=1620943 RepID=A0ABV6M2B1_9ACTN
MTISALSDSGTRNLYRREIENIIGRQLRTPRDPALQADLFQLVRGCEQEPDGLAALLEVVTLFNEGARVATDVRRLIEEWSREQQLIALLADTPQDDVLNAIVAVTGSRPSVNQIASAVQTVGWQRSDEWGAPAILAVVDVLSAGPGSNGPVKEWLDRVARDLGWSRAEIDGLRTATIAHLQKPIGGQSVMDRDGNQDDAESEMRRIIIEEASTGAPIRGGIPARNLYFTGRSSIMGELESILEMRRQASVLPEATLHGYGGVGKTQIAVEFTYRNADNYQLIWWMSAEDPSAVRAQLSVLAARLGLTSNGTMDLTVRSVLDTLASTTSLRWLLVYDNANDPSSLDGLIPSAGGHVLVTSRNPNWSASGPAVEVDVFSRPESMELLRRHHPEMSDSEADRLAGVLGDLPLALEQAATWMLTTLTSVDDYLREFERRKSGLMGEARPRHYPNTVLTFVNLAVERMHREAPVAAQMLELMAFLAPDPISNVLLWEGRNAEITEPLRSALQERNDIARSLRDLVRFGVAKADKGRRVTVHRLVQMVLREELTFNGRLDGLRNARRLLAAANPGYPDDRATWVRHSDLRPHVRTADLIHGEIEERQAVMDQLRYVYNTGDFEGCCQLAVDILEAWDKPVEEGGYGAEDVLTLLAMRRYADALRSLGDRRAGEYARRALDGMLAVLGERHEYTMGALMGVGADLRIEGRFEEARSVDDQNLEYHLEVLGPGDPSTLRALNCVSINRRWAGDFKGAYEVDVEAERQSRGVLGELEVWTFFAMESQAWDLLLLGRYAEALALQESVLPDEIALLGEGHLAVLRARTLVAAMLRKTGKHTEAVAAARDIYRNLSIRFGAKHGQTLRTTVTLANNLRAAGDAGQALRHITEAHEGFLEIYGEGHGLTLCTALDKAVVYRALGFDRDALDLDEAILPAMTELLGAEHPFTLSLRVNHGTDLARAHRLDEALAVTSSAWQDSTRLRGSQHPYSLHAANNVALHMIDLGRKADGEGLRAEALAGLELVYGRDHPETDAARRHRRLECELEPCLI